MAVLPILVLLIGLMAGAVLVAILVQRVRRRPPDAAVARRVVALQSAGVTVGVIVGIIAARSGDLGVGLLMAAPLFGLCTLIGVLAGELTVRPPDRPTRTAVVEVRRIRDYLPRQLSRVVAATGGVLLVLVTVTTAAGGPDDMGRPGRSLVRQCTSDMSASYGPWPGLFYAGRLVVVVLVGLLMAYAAVRTIVRRPRSGSTSDLAVDDALRRHSASVVTGAVGVLVAIPLAGVSLTAAGGLLGSTCPPWWWTITGWVLVALIPASLAVVSRCIAAVLAPRNRADLMARTR